MSTASAWGRPALLIGLSIALLLAGQAMLPGFFGLGQVANQLKIAAFLGLFGLCQTIVIAAGGQGLDLSVGAIATLGGILGTTIMGGSDAVTPLAGLVAVAAGLAVGCVNGFGIAVLRIPPLVATLAMASVVDGGLIVFDSVLQPSHAASPVLVGIAGRSSAGVPNIVIVWALVTAAAVWILARSAWGRRLAGTGANPIVALLSGTNVTLVKIAAYALSGGIAALTGFFLTGYVGQAFLGLGNAYILTSIVVAAIGGVALTGGAAPYPGVVAAAIMMTVLVSLLTAIDIGEAGRQIVFGATLLAFLLLDRYMASARNRPYRSRIMRLGAALPARR
jgi:ribose transport system permease protein